MKTPLVSFARPAFFALLLLLLATPAFSQKTTTWQGGTPGRENHWDCPSNWSTNTVPNEFSNVVIPDVSTTTQASPVIRAGTLEVNGLQLESTALLTLRAGVELIVHGQVAGVHAGNLVGPGVLRLLDEADPNKGAGNAAAH